jgi:hypothetical protein
VAKTSRNRAHPLIKLVAIRLAQIPAVVVLVPHFSLLLGPRGPPVGLRHLPSRLLLDSYGPPVSLRPLLLGPRDTLVSLRRLLLGPRGALVVSSASLLAPLAFAVALCSSSFTLRAFR